MRHLLLLCLAGSWLASLAQWDGNPLTVDNPVSVTPLHEKNIFSVADGAGGAIMAWEAYDPQSTALFILMQRKTAQGTVAWGTVNSPVQVATVSSGNYFEISDLMADGIGGAWVAWIEGISDTLADVYLQRYSSTGSPSFPAPGIRQNPANGRQSLGARLCAVSNGLIACWSEVHQPPDAAAATYAQVFAQRYSNSGEPQWAGGSVQVCTAPGLRALASVVSDGSDGALIAFSDARNSGTDPVTGFDNADIYAQRLSASGSRLWTDTGRVVCNLPFNQYTLEAWESVRSMVSDGAGGMIVAYHDWHNGNQAGDFFFAQRLDASGNRLWPADGVPLSTEAVQSREYLVLESNGAQGIVACWKMTDYVQRLAAVAQHINGAGTPEWGISGKLISKRSSAFGAQSAGMAADGAGYFVMNWTELDTVTYYTVVRAQRYNSGGVPQWTPGGVAVCMHPSSWPGPASIVRTAADRMMLAWTDYRNSSESDADIYAAMLQANGSLLGTLAAAFVTVANGSWSNPQIWQGGAVPPPGAAVLIRHQVIGDSNATCSGLRLEPGSSLFILMGITISLTP